jgi:hypothetical protein
MPLIPSGMACLEKPAREIRSGQGLCRARYEPDETVQIGDMNTSHLNCTDPESPCCAAAKVRGFPATCSSVRVISARTLIPVTGSSDERLGPALRRRASLNLTFTNGTLDNAALRLKERHF